MSTQEMVVQTIELLLSGNIEINCKLIEKNRMNENILKC